MALNTPGKEWYATKVAKDERSWIAFSVIVALALFVWMAAWHLVGKQNPPASIYKTTPDEFYRLAQANWQKYKIGEEDGIPVVKPPSGGDVFLIASTWKWEPILVLKKNHEYKIHISSLDLLHGFSLQPVNMNFQIHPGYDFLFTFKPTSTGEFKILCNEYCGFGHHSMIGKIIVEE